MALQSKASIEGFYFRGDRSDMAVHVPAAARTLLDVGCGTGGFGALVKTRQSLDAWGIEPHPAAAREAASALDCVLQGTLETVHQRLPDGHFDVISFNDVLEHLADPVDALRLIRPKLSSIGVVIASIPNLRQFQALKRIVWDGDFPSEEFGIFDRTHLRFFTRRSIPRLFEAAGYSIVMVQGMNASSPESFVRRQLWKLTTSLLPRFRDTAFLQFACVAKPSS